MPVVFVGKNEIDARPLIVAAEQQMRIRNDDGIRRGMGGEGVDMAVRDWNANLRPECEPE